MITQKSVRRNLVIMFASELLATQKAITDFYAFTPDSFRLEGYQAHPVGGKIPVAV